MSDAPKIISLAEKRAADEAEAYDPHISGEAQCVDCGHKWVAVAPVGTTDLECPHCGTMRGTWSALTRKFDKPLWQCGACDNIYFVLHEKAITCARCGTDHHGIWD